MTSSRAKTKPIFEGARFEVDALVRIPASAKTFAGFCAWRAESEIPNHYRVTRVADILYWEFDDTSNLVMPVKALTYSGFNAWTTSEDIPEHTDVTFVDQEVLLDMSPEEIETHIKVKTALTIRLGALCCDQNLGSFLSDGLKITHAASQFSAEPDGTFVSWDSLRTGRAVLVPRTGRAGEFMSIEGPPDLVVEVISRSSKLKDTRILRRGYHRAGVREYWLINALEEEIDFQILLHRTSGFIRAPSRHGWSQSQVFDRGFRLRRERDPVGLWAYFLDIRDS